MNLSSEVFEALVRGLRQTAHPAGEDERRAEPRAEAQGVAWVIPCPVGSGGEGGAGRPQRAMVQDVSPKSVRLFHVRMIQPGVRFILYLGSASGGRGRAVLCAAVRWSPVQIGMFEIGAVFLRELAVPHSVRPPGADRIDPGPADAPEALPPLGREELAQMEWRLAKALEDHSL